MTGIPKFTPLIGAACLVAGLAGPAGAQTPLPSNVMDTCVVSSSEFDSWKAPASGVFKAADSVTFDDANDCNFFKWGAQMFLWLTSQPDGTLVFDGPDFFGVSDDAYVAQDGNAAMTLQPRVVKPQEDTGAGQAGGGGVLISPQGEIIHYGINTNNVYAYYQTGVKSTSNPANFQGELATDFPTTAADLTAITNYADSTFGTSGLSSGDALAMELKTSWIDAASLDNPQDYVTAMATVATFEHTSETTWTQTGTALKRVALVGMHIVGSVNNHPEMVWATFEHINNAPQNGYLYFTTFGTIASASYDGNGNLTWLFNDSPQESHTPVLRIVERATYSGSSTPPTITADSGETIGPNTVVRINPWGDAPIPNLPGGAAQYSGNSSALTRATDLISLNRSVLNWIGDGDVRSNYIQTGSIWSSGGPDAIPTSGTDSVLRGTRRLANATMETFHQFPDSSGTGSFKPENCFGCHSVDKNDSPSQGVSHIFDSLTPLTPQ
ncbi:hypothetical protein [Thalassobaculum salexigens]|uniref:hypothetical protein n=1 Tax=Thalassobaculum salexigens TaxID=455360 RepID=UPI0012EBA2C7|nr:hypothetical protein [Thalassobaculum salexigens]